MIPNIDVLGSLAKNLHQEFVNIYYLMLPIFFTLAVIIEWFKTGSLEGNFVEIIRRAFICTLVLVAFKDISQALIFISDGIAEKIDDMTGLDAFIKMASEKCSTYSFSVSSVVLAFDDFIIAVMSYLSYFLLHIARYFTLAMYYFYWVFLSITAPLLLLFGLFKSTTQIPINLFRSMCEVASWKVVWAILSAMLQALAFGQTYMEGSYITIIILNFVIAAAIICTPLIVRSLVGSGIHATTSQLATTIVAGALLTNKMAGFVANARSQNSASTPLPNSNFNSNRKPLTRRGNK